jgi:hypothetical protein
MTDEMPSRRNSLNYAVSFIREVFHPKWLANPVLIHKKNTN